MRDNIRHRRGKLKKKKALLAAKCDLLTLTRGDRYAIRDYIRRGRIKKKRGPQPPRKALGFIYFVEAGPFVKIGWSSKDASRRISSMQTGCPYVIKVLGMCRVKATTGDERALHRKFRAHHFRGEWFHLTEDIKLFVRTHCRPEETAKMEASISHILYPNNL